MHLMVKCVISESAGGASTQAREFAGPHDLETALRTLGVSEQEVQAAHQVFHSWLPTFIQVSLEVAKKLGALD